MSTALAGTFYEVARPSGECAWLAIHVQASDHFWVLDFNTRRFHINPAWRRTSSSTASSTTRRSTWTGPANSPPTRPATRHES